MVKFGGEIGTLYQMLKNAFKKHPLQNRTNVQIKGGGGQRPFEQCSKKLHFFEKMASLSVVGINKCKHYILLVSLTQHLVYYHYIAGASVTIVTLWQMRWRR